MGFASGILSLFKPSRAKEATADKKRAKAEEREKAKDENALARDRAPAELKGILALPSMAGAVDVYARAGTILAKDRALDEAWVLAIARLGPSLGEGDLAALACGNARDVLCGEDFTEVAAAFPALFSECALAAKSASFIGLLNSVVAHGASKHVSRLAEGSLLPAFNKAWASHESRVVSEFQRLGDDSVEAAARVAADIFKRT